MATVVRNRDSQGVRCGPARDGGMWRQGEEGGQEEEGMGKQVS